MRIGHGFDVHKFGGQGPIVLAGVKIDYKQGFIAHSDGDVLIHAVCDAILGALGLGDIGRHFPDTSAEYENIDSRILLRNVFQQMQQNGYRVSNLDCTIVAQAPKMSPHIAAMESNLAADLEVSDKRINVKATTTEKLGYTGRSEGIAAHVVVLLEAV